MAKLGVFAAMALALVQTLGAQERRARWTEEDFYRKAKSARPLSVPPIGRVGVPAVIGNTRYYQPRDGDTFLDIARYYGLGYNDVKEANPNVDEWIPSPEQELVLPTEFILPDTAHEGVVINVPEMRLYYFHPRKPGEVEQVTTYPVGLGRDEWRTPTGKFKITEKTVNPTWNIPVSIQKERQLEGDFTKEIAGGNPDNPLGKYRMRLSLDLFGIHGTNIPWGVGMQVSHGCIRLYPEDIEQLYPVVPVSAPGEFVYQPVKVGMRDGRIYIEVHNDIYRLKPALFSEARGILTRMGLNGFVEMARVQRAVEQQSGVPLDISLGSDDGARDRNRPPTGNQGGPSLRTL